MKHGCSLILVAFLTLGCGGTTPVEPDPNGPKVTSEDELKDRIDFIANSGGMGSAFAGVAEMAEKKGDKDLVVQAKQLEKSKTPEQAKVIARKMLERFH